MEVNGSVHSQAARQKLWDALMNTDVWKEAIPEAEKYELVGEDVYEMVVRVDIGPVKGSQTIKVQFLELQPPDSCDFELQHMLVKTVKGNFTIIEPHELVVEEGEEPPPEGTTTVLTYRIEADSGNSMLNAMIETLKDRIKGGFEEVLVRIETQARNI
jgi:hypothetical protein